MGAAGVGVGAALPDPRRPVEEVAREQGVRLLRLAHHGDADVVAAEAALRQVGLGGAGELGAAPDDLAVVEEDLLLLDGGLERGVAHEGPGLAQRRRGRPLVAGVVDDAADQAGELRVVIY